VRRFKKFPISTRAEFGSYLSGTWSLYRVALACEHWRIVTNRDLEREQLFVGKAVACAECGKGSTGSTSIRDQRILHCS